MTVRCTAELYFIVPCLIVCDIFSHNEHLHSTRTVDMKFAVEPVTAPYGANTALW